MSLPSEKVSKEATVKLDMKQETGSKLGKESKDNIRVTRGEKRLLTLPLFYLFHVLTLKVQKRWQKVEAKVMFSFHCKSPKQGQACGKE